MRKTILGVVYCISLCALMSGCTKGPKIVKNPGDALAKALPPEWAISVTKENWVPPYGGPGKGTAFFLVKSGTQYVKQDYSVVVYIMPRNYEYHPEASPDHLHQTSAARLVSTCANGKVYIWGLWGGAPELQRLILSALIKQ